MKGAKSVQAIGAFDRTIGEIGNIEYCRGWKKEARHGQS